MKKLGGAPVEGECFRATSLPLTFLACNHPAGTGSTLLTRRSEMYACSASGLGFPPHKPSLQAGRVFQQRQRPDGARLWRRPQQY